MTRSDGEVLQRIQGLVDEEHALLADEQADRARLDNVRVELDQCWDLLRQRRAKREFGEDPADAEVRPAEVVETYEQ